LAAPLVGRRARRWWADVTGRVRPIDDWLSGTALRSDLADDLDLERRIPYLAFRRLGQSLRLSVPALASQADLYPAVEARWGHEHRDPTSDRRVIEVALTQPPWVRRSEATTRAVARRAMAPRLPASIVSREARGAQLPDWFDRCTDAREEIIAELDALRDHPTSRELIDVRRLDRLVQHWPTPERAGDREVVSGYRLALPRALLLSRYLRWFEERGRRVRTNSR
jgi:asparagine synthase (glutamine-hydrolysing)